MDRRKGRDFLDALWEGAKGGLDWATKKKSLPEAARDVERNLEQKQRGKRRT